MTSDLIIDASNFDDYFFDVRKHSPKPGQVLACYDAVAELIDGNLKRDLIELLLNTDKAEAASLVLQKLGAATADDAVRVCKEIVEDLLQGLTPDEVAAKPYRFRLQQFFYTDREHIPDNDPHWWSTSLIEVKSPRDFTLTPISDECENIDDFT